MTRTWWNTGALLLWLYASVVAAQSAPNWTRQIPQNFPLRRAGHAMAYDSAHGQAVLFGGSSPVLLNDTWVWDGSNWEQKSPQTSPPVRYFHAMAYDAAHGQVVLFGGTGPTPAGVDFGTEALNDTWVWDGSNWTQESPQTSPSVRYSPAMAYDAAHGQVVLFGGAALNPDGTMKELNDTWVWDGSNWTEKSPQTSPPVRDAHAMAFDSAHGQVVLFGGEGASFALLNDTWVWDGANWIQKSPQISPSARSGHAMAYDSAHGQVLLFGGVDDGQDINDTWVWDGSNWTQESPQTNPPARDSHAMAYDSAHDQTVLFGGENSFSLLGDTWTWEGGAPPPVAPSIGSVVSASSYGGFPAVSPASFVEIYGSNLAFDTRGWTKADFTGNQAPTSLDGVQVSIAGQKAFVNYIVANPGQVNVQLPSNIPTGTQQIVVMNKNGTSSPFNVTVNATEPGLLAPASFKVGGKQYVVAFHSDNVTYVLPSGAIAGIPSRPAKPGETIVMYGNGFGPVTPNIPAGELVQGDNQLVAALEILFGGTPGQLAYYGLSPGLVGVYQFDVVVPAIPNNDLVPLSFKLGGVAGTQIVYTAVHQ
jgi:uncharacterized protein (TIGR03437 family)